MKTHTHTHTTHTYTHTCTHTYTHTHTHTTCTHTYTHTTHTHKQQSPTLEPCSQAWCMYVPFKIKQGHFKVTAKYVAHPSHTQCINKSTHMLLMILWVKVLVVKEFPLSTVLNMPLFLATCSGILTLSTYQTAITKMNIYVTYANREVRSRLFSDTGR